MKVLSVGLGGIAGALARYVFYTHLNFIAPFPWGTLLVNLLGSFFLAFFLAIALIHIQHRSLLVLAVSTGFTGSFTTFSSLSVEAVNLFSFSPLLGLTYIAASLLAGLSLAFLGKALGEFLSGFMSRAEREDKVID